jgi:hypothetical protein
MKTSVAEEGKRKRNAGFIGAGNIPLYVILGGLDPATAGFSSHKETAHGELRTWARQLSRPINGLGYFWSRKQNRFTFIEANQDHAVIGCSVQFKPSLVRIILITPCIQVQAARSYPWSYQSRFAMWSHIVFLSLLSLPVVWADPSHLRLFHRVYHPISPQIPFSKRGILIISDSNHVSFQPSQTLSRDLIHFAEALEATEGGAEGALYQVALEREGDLVEGHSDISSVKVVSADFRSRPPTLLSFCTSFPRALPERFCPGGTRTIQFIYVSALPLRGSLVWFTSDSFRLSPSATSTKSPPNILSSTRPIHTTSNHTLLTTSFRPSRTMAPVRKRIQNQRNSTPIQTYTHCTHSLTVLIA